jgi:hypothetical protein
MASPDARNPGNCPRHRDLRYAVAHGDNTTLLNFVGDSYFGLGRLEEARAVWERSLTADPNQPEIVKKIDLLPRKKP